VSWRWLEDDDFKVAFQGIAEDDVEAEMDKRSPQIDAIARQLKEIQRTNEQEGFLRQARYEDGDDYYDHYDPYEDLEENEREAAVARDELHKKIKAAQEDAKVQVLEEALARLGARLARNYEHWNEDEKYMEYMERER